MYKEYFIRLEGIECKVSEDMPIDLLQLQEKNDSLLEAKISSFYLKKEVSNDVQNCINSYYLKVNDFKEVVV